jgi:hypothetical protein
VFVCVSVTVRVCDMVPLPVCDTVDVADSDGDADCVASFVTVAVLETESVDEMLEFADGGELEDGDQFVVAVLVIEALPEPEPEAVIVACAVKDCDCKGVELGGGIVFDAVATAVDSPDDVSLSVAAPDDVGEPRLLTVALEDIVASAVTEAVADALLLLLLLTLVVLLLLLVLLLLPVLLPVNVTLSDADSVAVTL